MHRVWLASKVQLQCWNSFAFRMVIMMLWLQGHIIKSILYLLFQNPCSLADLWSDKRCHPCVVPQLFFGKTMVNDGQLIDIIIIRFWVKYDDSLVSNCALSYLLQNLIVIQILLYVEGRYTVLYSNLNFRHSCPIHWHGVNRLRPWKNVLRDVVRVWFRVMIATAFALEEVKECSLL